MIGWQQTSSRSCCHRYRVNYQIIYTAKLAEGVFVEVQEKKKIHYGWMITLGGFFAEAIMMIAIQLVPLQLNSIATDLGLSNTSASLIISVYGLTSGLAALVWGFLADHIGVRKAITAAACTVGVFAVLFGVAADSLVKAIIFYGIVGVGAAGVFTATISKLVGAWFYPDKRGRAMSLITPGSVIFGMILGASIPSISAALGWHQTSVMMGCIALILAVLVFLIIRNDPKEMGLEPIGTQTVETEPKVKNKAQRWRIFQLRITWHLGIMYIFWQMGYLVISGFMAKAFIEAGAGPAAAGLAVSTYSLGQLVGQQIWGPLSDRIERKYVVAIAGTIWALCAIGFFVSYGNVPFMFAMIVLMGIGLGMVPVIMAMFSDYFPPEFRGSGAGTVATIGMVGRTLGPILGGLVADAMGILSGAFIFAACSMIISMIITLTLPKHDKKEVSADSETTLDGVALE